ncbi:MAG: hypothetical protein EOO71_02045 [Myxococcaceae bacterium]|nr:MAG: hypothetical protein EOO71_02045 [Myxococcaceae bacterium]
MSKRFSLGALGVLASLCLSPTAWASPADDFYRGQDFFLNAATVRVDGREYSTAGFRVIKSANTLDITLTGTDLGLPYTGTLQLTGVRSENIIHWSFDKVFSPPISLDGTNDIHRMTGEIRATASLLSGKQIPRCNHQVCPRNVVLNQLPGSEIIVQGQDALGTGFSRQFSVPFLRALGGVGQPGLSGFLLSGSAPLCSAPFETQVPLSAFLTGSAPTGGTKIDFKSTNPRGVKVPPNVIIPAGQSYASFKARVAAGFTGQVSVSAASSGTVVSRLLTIASAGTCGGDGGNRTAPFDVRALVPELLLGCVNCSEFIDVGFRDTGLVKVLRVDSYFNGTQLRPLSSVFDAASVTAVDMTDTGLVTGMIVPQTGNTPVAYKASLEGGPVTPVLLGDFTPTRIAPSGTVFGHRTSRTGNIAVYHDGRALTDLPIPSASASWITAVSEAGHVAGNYVRSGDVKAFVFTDGTLRTLPQLSRITTTVPVAINIRGQVVANSVDATGDVLATALIDTDDTVHVLSIPAGFDRLRATSINARGWVTATATSLTGSTGFLYTQPDGWVDLNQRLSPSAGVVVTEALRITDADQVVVNATAHGNRALYLLSHP